MIFYVDSRKPPCAFLTKDFNEFELKQSIISYIRFSASVKRFFFVTYMKLLIVDCIIKQSNIFNL